MATQYEKRIKLRVGQSKYLPHILEAVRRADFVIDQYGRVIKDRHGRPGRKATLEEIYSCSHIGKGV